jgi:flagellar hook-basal body complex protein FliE
MAIERILTALGSLPSTPGAPASAATDTTTATGFADSLERLVGAVESSGAQANQAVIEMTDGTGDVHDAMIALQRADLTLQLTVQIRNKLVNAYQEIMRMPV